MVSKQLLFTALGHVISKNVNCAFKCSVQFVYVAVFSKMHSTFVCGSIYIPRIISANLLSWISTMNLNFNNLYKSTIFIEILFENSPENDFTDEQDDFTFLRRCAERIWGFERESEFSILRLSVKVSWLRTYIVAI